MIEFEIQGRVPTVLRVGGKVTSVWETRWFDCVYVKKTKKAFYLRKNGEQGAELKLSKDALAIVTK